MTVENLETYSYVMENGQRLYVRLEIVRNGKRSEIVNPDHRTNIALKYLQVTKSKYH